MDNIAIIHTMATCWYYDILFLCTCMLLLKDHLPHVDCHKQTSSQEDTVITVRGTRNVKLGFLDDCTLFNKPSTYRPRVLVCPFQHVKHIKPSEVEKEFHHISGHVVQLLSCCHPKLLIKWCENLMASDIHRIRLLPPYSLYKLKKLKTSSAVLKLMNTLWSWNDHSILTCLAAFSEIAGTLLKEFDSRLYLNASLTEYPLLRPTPTSPYNNNSYTILTLKCEGKLKLSLWLVHEMQSVLIEKCEITEHALQLLAVQSSPLLLQWMISKYIVSIINVNVRQHCQYFATKGITEILIHPNIRHYIVDDVKSDLSEVCNLFSTENF